MNKPITRRWMDDDETDKIVFSNPLSTGVQENGGPSKDDVKGDSVVYMLK